MTARHAIHVINWVCSKLLFNLSLLASVIQKVPTRLEAIHDNDTNHDTNMKTASKLTAHVAVMFSRYLQLTRTMKTEQRNYERRCQTHTCSSVETVTHDKIHAERVNCKIMPHQQSKHASMIREKLMLNDQKQKNTTE